MLKNSVCDHPQAKDFAPLFGPGAVPGYMTDDDMYTAIPSLCQKIPPEGLLIEIGAFLGKSTVEWAKNLKIQNKHYKIISIDSFNSSIPVMHDLLKKAEFDIPNHDWNQLELFKHYTSEFPNIKPIKAFFNKDFVFPSKANLVFEDSTHTQQYLEYALPFWYDHLVDGGILAGHDYVMDDVRTAVDLFAILRNLEVKTFVDSSIWYIEKC